MMQLFVYLLLAAVLGFALGWLIRGGAGGALESGVEAERLETGDSERERLARELSAPERARRDLQGVLERMRAEPALMDGAPVAGAAAGAEQQALLEQAHADLDAAHRRITQLEGELARATPRASAPEAETGPSRAPAFGAAQPVGFPDGEAKAGTPPERLAGPQGRADDLKLISGIGPSIEKMLNGLGIYHFRQIAAFTPANVAWVDQRLRFRGRIAREDWIGQAQALAVEDVRGRA
jgi:predicted flap endonuclease-1-like 5' DNA nuclease